MKLPMPTLSIVIVNWNSKDLLRQCLLAVQRYASELAPQIVVVDGGSYDGCGEMLASDFPHVEFVQSKENVGFGRANNLGFERVTGEALLLLNPDAEVLPGALQLMLAELQNNVDAGIVGPRLLNSDHSLQTSIQALPRPLRQAFDSELLRQLLWPLKLWAPPTGFVPKGVIEVEATSGACMLLWSQTYREVGGFSHQYFMYAEDMDLCLEVSRTGRRIYHVPGAKLVHHGGTSAAAQGSAFSVVMMRHALYAYMMKNHGRGHATAYRLASAVAAFLRLLSAVPLLIISKSSKRALRRSAALANVFVISWSFGRQSWVRKYG